MDRIYSEMTSLQYENRALRKEIESFRNGERYKKLQQDHHRVIAGYERKISQLKKDLENERATRKRVRNLWIDQCKKDYDSYQAELEVKNRKMEKLEKEKLEIRKKYEETIASLIQNYEEKLEEKQNVIAELTARVEHAEAILAHDGTNTAKKRLYRTAVEAVENPRVVRKDIRSTSLKRRQKKKSTKKFLTKLKAEMSVLPADQNG